MLSVQIRGIRGPTGDASWFKARLWLVLGMSRGPLKQWGVCVVKNETPKPHQEASS